MPIIMSEYKILNEKLNKNLIPDTCTFEITNRCNFNCTHCYQKGHRVKIENELSTNEINKCIDKCHDAGVLSMAISGGEPFLRKDLFEILNHMTKVGLKVDLFTNAAMIGEEEAEALAKISNLDLSISLYGASENTYRNVTNTNGNFEKVIKALEVLRRKNVRFNIRALAMINTINDLEDIYKIAKDFNAVADNKNAYDMADARIIGELNEQKECRLDNRQLKKFYELRSTVNKKRKIIKDNFESFKCSGGRKEFAILANGDVLPCISWYNKNMGSIKDKDFNTIWNNSNVNYIRTLKYDTLKCNECKYLEFCNVCYMMFDLESGDALTPSSESCRHAKIKYEISKMRG